VQARQLELAENLVYRIIVQEWDKVAWIGKIAMGT